MSSHQIYIRCTNYAECGTIESVYTGDAYTFDFDDDWEGSFIDSLCNRCKAEEIERNTVSIEVIGE